MFMWILSAVFLAMSRFNEARGRVILFSVFRCFYRSSWDLEIPPIKHPARDFAIKNMGACYATPYLFSVWAEYNQPFVELNQILQIPIYDWKRDFIEGKHGYDCFLHIRAQKMPSRKLTMPSRIHEYWSDFFDNVSKHVS